MSKNSKGNAVAPVQSQPQQTQALVPIKPGVVPAVPEGTVTIAIGQMVKRKSAKTGKVEERASKSLVIAAPTKGSLTDTGMTGQQADEKIAAIGS